MTYLLNTREQQVVKELGDEYQRRHEKAPETDPDLMYHLGNSSTYRCWSAASGRLPTLRRGGGLMWSPKYRRIMTGREKLASLGFPVTSDSASAMRVPEWPVTDAKRAGAIAGNCMHWNSVGVAQLVALCSFKPA